MGTSQIRLRPVSLVILAPLIFSGACITERYVEKIIAEHGVTWIPEETTTDGTPDTSTSSTSTGHASTLAETAAMNTSTGGLGQEASADAGTSTGAADDGTTTEQTTGAVAVCGNGVVEPGEDCDDVSTFCNAACVRSRMVFITSEPHMFAGGEINGLVGADYQCRHRAAVMNFPNAERYRAWLSTSTVDARDRVEHHVGRYVLVNGLVVAEDWDELVSGSLQRPIDVTETSETHLDGPVWTGTRIDGTRVPGQSHCQDWTSKSVVEEAYAGASGAADQRWTSDQFNNPWDCASYAALYCIEQP